VCVCALCVRARVRVRVRVCVCVYVCVRVCVIVCGRVTLPQDFECAGTPTVNLASINIIDEK